MSTVPRDRESNHSRGFGFVKISDLKAAQTTIKELGGKAFEGRTIVANATNPSRQTNDRIGRDSGYRRSW